ncbi:hypothetical protein OS493_035154, partial [Desmophyllum pertusum]
VGQEFKNVWRVANESTKRLQSEMTSSMQVLQTKVDNEMETVWFHLNESRKCCNNLTSSFLSFRKNVTYHSKRIEDRIEIEEQKSNNTSQVEEQHSKKIQRLENLLNDTRKDINEVSREHFKTLWLAGNFTNAELRRVWTSMNLTQIDLLRQLKKVKDNLTEQLNLTKVHLQTSDASLFASLIAANASITKKVNNEMETVWFHLNKSKKCCNNLTTSLQSFMISVTYRSKRIEDRIEIEEQKSNNTSAVEEQHSKKIQRLENLLNDTRKDIKEVSREHFKTLWLAGNFTNAELHRVWTAVNLTQIDLLRQLKKVKYNLTEQLNLTTVHLQTSDASLFASLSEVNASITEKVNDVSKMAGPIGPPGYNGSQGPAGPAGSIGPPGPKGAGNFSSCQYKVVKDSAAGGVTTALVGQTEPDGKRITGATCSTNYATEYNMLTQLQAGGKWRFACSCKGTSALFRPGGVASTSKMKSENDIIEKVSENITSLGKRMEEHIKQVEKSCNEQNEELVNNEIETVWFHLDKSKKCCNNLTTSLQSFKISMTYRSKSIEDRIEIEEQKSNNTSAVEEQHSKNIQRLENLLNVTRQDINNVSQEHFKTLWLAGNFTNAELRRVKVAVNLTQIDLRRQLQKVKDNLTEQVNDVSKMAGPIGPPGHNGSQGPAGPVGSTGPPGAKGAGDFSSCQYKLVEDFAAGGITTTIVAQTEPDGKRVTGAACSTNYAAEYNLMSQLQATGKWRYVCICRGTSTLFTPRRAPKNCYLHYWECPLTT